jgi:hypothetical protein
MNTTRIFILSLTVAISAAGSSCSSREPGPGVPTSKEDAKARLDVANALFGHSLNLVNHHEEFDELPPVDGSESKEQPKFKFEGLSWRVYLAARGISDDENDPKQVQIVNEWLAGKRPTPKGRKRWDQPELQDLVVRPFWNPVRKPSEKGWLTPYRVFVGGGAAFEKGKPSRLTKDHFPDGLENTILIVEAAESVPWTKPDELPYDPAKPLPKLGGHFPDGFYAVFADKEVPKVRFIPKGTDEKLIRAWITRNGGEKVELPPKVDMDALRKAAGIE